MKTFFTLLLVLTALASAHAQVFRPAAVRGAAWDSRTHVSVGYGSANGIFLGATFGDGPSYRGGWGRGWGYRPYYAPPVYVYRSAPVFYSDYAVDPGYVYDRPSAASSGLWLGALAGAIIGHNSGSLGHNAWRGAAYGAGAGLILGAIADSRTQQREAVAERSANVRSMAAEVPATSAQPVTIINNYYNAPAGTPMSSANGLFGRN